MITLSMNKIVTYMKDLSEKRTLIVDYKYKELEAALQNDNEITVKYCFAQRKKRVKQLEQLGYTLKETISYDDTEPYSKIRQVWIR
ncbi:hypothetical protein ABEY43_06645 [Priestia megaterium]